MYKWLRRYLLIICSLTATSAADGQNLEHRSRSVDVHHLSRWGDGTIESRVPWHPYWRIRDTSKYALIAKLIDTNDKLGDQGRTRFEIVDVIRSPCNEWGKGMIIQFPLRVVGESGDHYGLYTSTSEIDLWLRPEPLNQTIIEYLKEIPAEEESRLRFFLEEIEAKDAVVAYDAYEGLRQKPTKQLISLRGRLPITQLRNRLLSFSVGPHDKLPADLYSFYDEMGSDLLETMARIVGACGMNDDVEALEVHIRKQPSFRRDALMAAYLVLRGEAGMEQLEQDIDQQRAADVGDAAGMLDLLKATELLCLYPENPIPRQRAVELAVSELSNPGTAAGAIHALATWKEWKVIDRVTELFPPNLTGDAFTRKAVVFYLMSCADDATSTYAARASMKLRIYENEYPDLFYDAKASFKSMSSAWHRRMNIEPSHAPEPACRSDANGESFAPSR